MTHPRTLDAHQAHSRLHELIVLDVRTPGEYATGHLPGALNVPLDHLTRALPDIREAAARGDILVVCASGTRSEAACKPSPTTASPPPPSPEAPEPGPTAATPSTTPTTSAPPPGAWSARSASPPAPWS